jgi:hypothetical protein
VGTPLKVIYSSIPLHLFPTQTNIIIPNSSCHPFEHKVSGINYILNRINTYPLTKEGKQTEINTTKSILHNKEYDINIIDKLTQKNQKKEQNTMTEDKYQKVKWATFTYNTKEVRKITKLF